MRLVGSLFSSRQTPRLTPLYRLLVAFYDNVISLCSFNLLFLREILREISKSQRGQNPWKVWVPELEKNKAMTTFTGPTILRRFTLYSKHLKILYISKHAQLEAASPCLLSKKFLPFTPHTNQKQVLSKKVHLMPHAPSNIIKPNTLSASLEAGRLRRACCFRSGPFCRIQKAKKTKAPRAEPSAAPPSPEGQLLRVSSN